MRNTARWLLLVCCLMAAWSWAAEEPPPPTLEQAAPELTVSPDRLYGTYTFWRQTDDGYEAGFIDFAIDYTWTMVVHLDTDYDRYPDQVTVLRGTYQVTKRDDASYGYALDREGQAQSFLDEVTVVNGHVRQFTWQYRQFRLRTGDMPYFVMAADVTAVAGEVSIETTPPGAKVYVDGVRLAGITPLKVKRLNAGVPLHVRAELEGYLTSEQVITLRPDEPRMIEFSLSRGGSGLHVVSQPRVRVKLDGEWIGYSPVDRIGVAPGHHVLELVNDTVGIYHREDIEVPANQTWRKRYEFNGRLVIDVGRPCKIYRQDRLAGETPFDDAVPAGHHLLNLIDAQGRKKLLIVDVPLDGTVRIERPFDSLPDAE